MNKPSSHIAARGVLILAPVALLAGCSGPVAYRSVSTVDPAAFRAEGDPVVLAEFAQQAEERASETRARIEADSTQDGSGVRTADAGAGAYRVRPGLPDPVDEPGRPVEELRLLDAKVGDINGRPIFVSEFLGPLEGRLRAEAERMGREEWMRAAAGMIQEEMRSLITDELLKAEALSRLSVEQKAGLRRFLEEMRRNLRSENRGSQQLAEQRLLSDKGITQEQFLRQRENRTLVRFTLQEEIQGRIHVSWRDILQRYARDDEKYNPDPTARFYILRVPLPPEPEPRAAEDEEGPTDEMIDELVEQMADRLVEAAGEPTENQDSAAAQEEPGTPYSEAVARFGAGDPIEDIAGSEINTWTIDPGGVREIVLTGELSDIVLFRPAELNDPVRAMGVGETVGPIEYQGNAYWVHLDTIVSEKVSLYDAQLEIAEQIRSERTSTELQRYIDRLLGRASVSDVDRMMMRLLAIAADRYGPGAGG